MHVARRFVDFIPTVSSGSITLVRLVRILRPLRMVTRFESEFFTSAK